MRPDRPAPAAVSTVPQLLAWRAGIDGAGTALRTVGGAGLTFGQWLEGARRGAAVLTWALYLGFSLVPIAVIAGIIR